MMQQEKLKSRKPVLLMVDDDEEDVYLTRRAFCAHRSDLIFNSVPDSKSLFDYLYCRGEYENRSDKETPQVLLLDINIPGENGFEILKKLKADPNLAHLPVTMLSTSAAERDIDKAYSLGANSFISKSISAGGMKQIAESFCEYWFGLVHFPRAK